MRWRNCLALLFVATSAGGAPVALTCIAGAVSPINGRLMGPPTQQLAFTFDQEAQSFVADEAPVGRGRLQSVSVTDSAVSGVSDDGKWMYRLNRIDGTVALSSAPGSPAAGAGGPYMRGNCNPKGAGKF